MEKFWRGPALPLISPENVARRAIFDALHPDEDGTAWELVSANGEPLVVTAPEQLLLFSSNQFLRTAECAEGSGGPTPPPGPAPQPPVVGPTPGPVGPGPEPGGRGSGLGPHKPTVYHVHEMVLSNHSLTDRDARAKLFQLLSDIADVVDPSSGKDVQVATIRVELNAAEGTLASAEEKARSLGATWVTRDEAF